MSEPTASELNRLLAGLLASDERALARAISAVDAGGELGNALLRAARPRGGAARVLGVTGSPGSGKSTLVDALIGVARARGWRVAVVAVDPSSPFSGGSILGDRIRMMRWHDDPGVFIRSMASRGHLGGLAAGTLKVVALLEAAGFDLIIIETVGVGQSEVAVVEAADTTVLVLTPGAGDGVQAFKAGIMEIADVICLNKADLPGVRRLAQEVRSALDLVHPEPGAWRTPLVQTVATDAANAADATQAAGVGDLLERAEGHREWLAASGRLAGKRHGRVRAEIMATLETRLRRRVVALDAAAVERVLSGSASPEEIADELLAAG